MVLKPVGPSEASWEQATSRQLKTSKHAFTSKENLVMKALSAITTVVGAATLLMAGYVFLAALPDLRRYIKITTM